MNAQTSMFSCKPARARKSDPATSKEAGRKAAAFAKGHKHTILTVLKAYGDLTGKEIASHCTLSHVAVMRRLCELRRDGVVDGVVNGSRPLTRGGSQVWRLI